MDRNLERFLPPAYNRFPTKTNIPRGPINEIVKSYQPSDSKDMQNERLRNDISRLEKKNQELERTCSKLNNELQSCKHELGRYKDEAEFFKQEAAKYKKEAHNKNDPISQTWKK